MKLFARLGLAVALIVAIGGPGAALAQEFPALTGRVVDQAQILLPEEEAALTQTLAALEADTSDQLVVVTIPDLEGHEIADYGYRLGRAWGIGQSETDNGALLIVAPGDRQVRIEVGYGLEPILTDAWSALVIHEAILPRFRTGDYFGGITAGVEAIDGQLRLDPEEAQARAAAVEAPRAGAPVGPAILIAIVFLFLFLGLIGGGALRGRRRRGNGVASVILWTVAESLADSARRGGGRGGWGGGGGFGGGGFSGGGGGFGGGGASGGW